jgi:hypothetical protein
MLKCAIVGGRDFIDYGFMKKVLDEKFDNLSFVECIVSGGAKGADMLAERYAKEIGRPVVVFKPDYKTYGRGAALVRNTQIIEYSDVVYAFWDGRSRGTRDAIYKAQKLGKILYVIRYNQDDE